MKNKNGQIYFLLSILLFLIIMSPVHGVFAAANISVTGFSQTMRTVSLKWKPVSGADGYIITRTSADGATGKVNYHDKSTWKQKSCAFTDTKIDIPDYGKVFCYRIEAVDGTGKTIAVTDRQTVKVPTCVINSIKVAEDGTVTLKWNRYPSIAGFCFQWTEGTNFNTDKVKTQYFGKGKLSAVITGLTPGKQYSFRIRGKGKGLYSGKEIISLGWPSTKSVYIPVKKATVVLHHNDGAVYKTITVNEGSSYTLPSMLNPKGFTFIGWGEAPNITVSESTPYNTPYKAYMKLKNLQGKRHLYAVLSNRSKEKDLTKAQLLAPDTSRFKKIIFIGDSRTTRMQRTLERIGIDTDSGRLAFVSKPSTTLDWIKQNGYAVLLKEIGETDPKDKRPIALVFNMGVNSLGTAPSVVSQSYISYYRSIAPELQKKGCKLYFMSVNPVVSAQFATKSSVPRQEWRVRDFNYLVMKGLEGTYTYIDMNRWLLRTGFGTDEGAYRDTGVDDGLHYTDKTYKRIFWKTMIELGKNN